MATTDTAKQQLAAQRGGDTDADRTPAKRDTATWIVDQLKPQMSKALPATVGIDRFARVALTALRTTPKLVECDPKSVMGALMLSAQLGLEPNTPLGHSYLIPFWNSKRRTYECQWVIGYTGIIDLARRSGSIETIIARPVYADETFEVEYGLSERLVHTPNIDADVDERQLRGVYAIAKYVGGGHNFVWLNRSDIDKAKQQSQTGRNNKGPWVEHHVAMALKTAVRRLRPFLPMSVEMRHAFEADEGTALWSDDEDVIDVEPVTDQIEAQTSQNPEEGATDDDVAAEGDATAGGDGAGSHDAGRDASEEAPAINGEESQEAAEAERGSSPTLPVDEDTGQLSKTQYAELRDAGITDELRPLLVAAVTDGRTDSTRALTGIERRRVMKAAALTRSKQLSVVPDGPGDTGPVLLGREGDLVDPVDLDDMTVETTS